MAADKKAEKKDEGGAGDDAAAEAKRKKKKLFIMIGLGVLLIAITVGSTLMAVKLMSPKKTAESDAPSEEHAAESSESVPAAPAIYFALKPNFTVNFDVNGRQRFLQTEITLMYREDAIQKLLEKHMPTVRNGLVMLLSGQSFDELQTVEGKEALRSAALKTIQDILNKEREKAPHDDKKEDKKDDKKKAHEEPSVEQVLFTQFVMQ